MSMKSEKLQELVSGILSDPNSQVAQRADYVVADMLLPVLIERVETRCRDRAVRALNTILGEISIDVMQGKFKLGIDYRENFLKLYDDE